jgi:predicted acyltransferase
MAGCCCNCEQIDKEAPMEITQTTTSELETQPDRKQAVASKGSDLALSPQSRLMSLDFFRGFTMFLLIAEGTHIYDLLVAPELIGTPIGAIGTQFHHHPWNGLRFWDLIQPFFMFIVGVAMPFSIGRRWEHGDSWATTFRHALLRSFLLLLFGWGVYCIGPGKLTFELWNVLAQLSFTYLVAFLMMRKSSRTQLGFTFALLAITELAYRLWSVPGFNEAFVPDRNFGSYVDLLLMGKLSRGHWVAFNAVPTTAHTMWGVLAGQLLKSERLPWQKIKILVIAGLIGVTAGYALNPVTPIIKRICTSSFVIVSGGWCLLALAFSYWLIDVKKIQNWARFFCYVGMNSLFIYLFTETGGDQWLAGIVTPFALGIFGWTGQLPANIAASLMVWGLLWYLCYWLYQRKIFIKI